ncbi:MAG: hypothetical protein J6U96_04090, partial [Elusimicrobiaceae bacterium]|nr:hypothetical protein [Elusimicrobiaceae bacterium]
KSRAAEAIILARFVKDAQEVYYLANSTYAISASELGISFQCPEKAIVCNFDQSGAFAVVYENYDITAGYSHREEQYAKLSGKLYCVGKSQSGNKFCQMFSSTPIEYGSNNRYEIK